MKTKTENIMNEVTLTEDQQKLAEQVRQVCVKAALDAYEEASIKGLCHEGAWEYAIDAISNLKIEEVLKNIKSKP